MKISREQLITSMQQIINLVPSKFYADLLFDSSSKLTIKKSSSGEQIIANLKDRGLVFRIFDGQRFHEISASLSELDLLEKKVRSLLTNISFSKKYQIPQLPPQHMDVDLKPEGFRDFTQINLQIKRNKIATFYKLMQQADPHVINPEINYFDLISERIFVNTEGSVLRQKIPKIGIYLKPMVKIDQKLDYDKLTLHGLAGFELLDRITPETLQELVESSKALTQAPLPPHGVLPTILGPTMAGALAHGIFGHGVQGDQILRGRSMWEKYYKQPVASSIVNISDSALEQSLYGSYLFDDEGILPKKTCLVKNGILTNYLHSRFTAGILEDSEALCGNGRRQDFHHPLFPRNSNTYFEAGDHNLDEMIEDIDYGLMVKNLEFGMEDPIGGTVQYNSRKGYLIKNGEIDQIVKGIALSGDSLTYLKSIDAISKDIVKFEGFDSRKGREDIVPVSFGAPYVKVNKSIVSPG